MSLQINPGDVVFHVGRGILSDAIRRVTRCPFSHVSMVMDVDYRGGGAFTVLDVLNTRVIQDIREHHNDYAWHVRAPRAPVIVPGLEKWYSTYGIPWGETRDHVVRHAFELHQILPKRYPYLELLGYLPFLRRKELGRRILRRTDRMVCSALVAAAWHAMGFRWYNGDEIEIGPDWVDPGTMWRQANRDRWPLVLTKEIYDAI